MALDLMAALGTSEGKAPAGNTPGTRAKPQGSSYLARKPPKLRAFLMDAVDPSLSQDERAEALCRAFEESTGAEPEEPDEAEESPPTMPSGPVGDGFEDY